MFLYTGLELEKNILLDTIYIDFFKKTYEWLKLMTFSYTCRE